MKSKLAGCTIDFNPGFSVKLKEEIGSGSFSSVYSTNDSRYVVKMINAADPKSLASYNNEKFAFKTMQRHNNIVFCPAFLDGVYLKGVNYCCLALENCSKGSVISMIVDGKITFQEHQIFRIMFEAISAVHHMHNLPRPIIHRDLKGENLLLGNDGRFKLTDFGSITTRKISNITSENRDDIEEDLNKNTTPTIRAPEQCDLYCGSPINEKVDIWAIGCLLYILCFHKQPFESRLATVNCQYFLPDHCQYSKTLLNLFPIIFTVDPRDRPSTGELLSYFESNTKRSLTNFVSKIETVNEYNQDAHQRRMYETSSGAPRRASSRDRPLSNSHSGQMQSYSSSQYNTVSSEAKVKPQFKDVLQKNIAMLTTKTEGWMLQALEENPKGPNQTYVQFLVAKAWVKPQKIKKFYTLLYKKQTRNPESTIITMKTLITLHTYLRKGPNDVYLVKETPSARFILNAIYQSWKITLQRDAGIVSMRDKVRDSYTTSLIYEYSEILLRKYDLQDKHHRTFQGNYALDPYFMMPVEESSPIAAPVIEDLLNYLDHLTNFSKMMFLQKHLWKIQCSIASALLDEEYCLISVLAHLLATFKHATNFITLNDNNRRVIQETTLRFEEKFAVSYEKASKFFEKCRGMQDFQLQSSIIPELVPEVLNEIRRVPILMDVKTENFQIKKFLNPQRAICNLTIPFSYNLAARNISSQITNIDYERNQQGYSPPLRQRQSPQVERYPQNNQSFDVNRSHQTRHIEQSRIIREERPVHIQQQPQNQNQQRQQQHARHPDQHLVRRHSNSVSSMEEMLRPNQMKTGDRPTRIQDIQKQAPPSKQLDFHANFEAFNQLNAQTDPNVSKKNQPTFNTNDLFAGFNFDLQTHGGVNPEILQQLKQNEGLQLLDVPENQQEDLAMAFSHQMVNTSFFNFGKSQNPSTEGQRTENPLMIINHASSSDGVVPEQQNLHLEKKPSIQKSASDQPITQVVTDNRVPVQNFQGQNVQNMPKPGHIQKNVSQPDLMEGDFYKMSSPERSQSVPFDGINMSPDRNYNTQGMGFRNGPHQQNFNHPMNPQLQQQMYYNTHGSVPSMAFQGRGHFNQQMNMNNMNMNMNMNLQQQMMFQQQQQAQMMMNQQNMQQVPFNPQYQNYGSMAANPYGNMNPQPQQRSPALPQQNVNVNNNNVYNQPQPQPQMNVNQVPNKNNQQQLNQIQPELVQSTVVPQKVQDQNQQQINAAVQKQAEPQQNQQQGQNVVVQEDQKQEKKEEKVVDELDLLFNQPKKENNPHPVQEEMKQDFEVMKTGEFGGWDELFNMGNNQNAQKFIDQENERKRLEEEARQKKAQNISLADTNINTSNLKKFFLQEISKNVADWIIDYKQLKFINQIGSGGSAEVYRGIWRGTDVAIKKMRLNNLPESRKKEFEREISALMKLRPQQNLVNFMGVSVTENELCIVMEYCFGGTLFEWLHVKRNVPINLRQRLKMAVDVASGMNYLHTCTPPFIHRDLKSLNLLLDGPIERESKRFTVKLADFGLAKAQELAQEKMTGLMGTYHWMAPEIFENKDYTIKADVYSFAIVLYEIITRETPYQNIKNPAAIMRYVTLEKGRPDLSKIPPNCPKQLLDLMMQCWEEDPDKRPYFGEILERLKELESWQLS